MSNNYRNPTSATGCKVVITELDTGKTGYRWNRIQIRSTAGNTDDVAMSTDSHDQIGSCSSYVVLDLLVDDLVDRSWRREGRGVRGEGGWQ